MNDRRKSILDRLSGARRARTRRHRRPLQLSLLVLIFGLGAAQPGCNAAPTPVPPTGNAVAFVYFVEADQTYRPEVEDAIASQAFALQQFWFEQFGGTFQLNDPVVTVIRAQQSAAWYEQTPNGNDPRWYRLMNMSSEVRATLGTQRLRYVNYPASTVSEPRVGANFNGAWMDGDDALCILDEVPSFPYPDGNDAHCLGHMAHEFGHVYGLGHTGPEADCMRFGFYDARNLCEFSADNRRKVQQSPQNVGWLDHRPGDIRGWAQPN